MKGHVYEYDEVVVGGNLAAVFYCYINRCPLIFKHYEYPHFYEYFESNFPLEELFLINNAHTLKTPDQVIEVGSKKIEIYDRFLFILSLSGLIPVSNKIEKIRVEDSQNLKITTDRSKIIKIKFNKLRIFNPQIVAGLSKKNVLAKRHLVHSRFEIACREHNCDFIEVGDNFVNKVFFYESKLRKRKVLITSYLLESELNDFDYSIIPMKYKLRDVFEKSGIEKHKNVREVGLDFLGRKVYNCDETVYEQIENVIFDNRTEKEICLNNELKNLTSTLLDVYPWRLNHLLLDSSGMIR